MTRTVSSFIAHLDRAKRILITTHVNPDGDALGTCAALVLGCLHRQIHAEVLLLSKLPAKYAFVFEDHNIRHHSLENGWPAGLELDSFDLVLVADTGTWSQLPGLREELEGWAGPKLVLDHHVTQENWATDRLVVTTAAAAGEIAAELLRQWEVPLEQDIAAAIYVALVSDTGWFQFSNTRPHTLRLAAQLIETGIDTDRIFQLLNQNERPNRAFLQARAMGSLTLHHDDRIAVMAITKADFEQTGASIRDTENLVNFPLQVRSVQIAALLSEPPEGGPIKVSLRSKGQFDCAAFAEQFGGGGHARAAGLKLPGPVAAAKSTLLERLQP